MNLIDALESRVQVPVAQRPGGKPSRSMAPSSGVLWMKVPTRALNLARRPYTAAGTVDRSLVPV